MIVIFAMHCMKMFVNFHIFCTLVYLRIVRFSLSSVVKRFEFLKALYKFPIIFIFSSHEIEISICNDISV